MNTLQTIFNDERMMMGKIIMETAQEDDYDDVYDHLRREPTVLFTGKEITIQAWGFYPNYWIQLFVLFLINSFISFLYAMVLYYLFIHQRNTTTTTTTTTNNNSNNETKQQQQQQPQPPYTSFIVYGILLPFNILNVFQLISFFNVRNMSIVLFGVAGPRFIMFARCLEVFNQTSPEFALRDLRTFLLYYVPMIRLKFEKKNNNNNNNNNKNEAKLQHDSNQNSINSRNGSTTTKNDDDDYDEEDDYDVVIGTWKTLFQKSFKFLLFSLVFGIIGPIAASSSFVPFPPKERIHILDYFYWGNLCNNYVNAYMVFLCLSCCTQGISIFSQFITGYETVEVTHHALTSSTAPSDFWGKRWNVIVHELLKSGIYKPIRKYFSRDITAVLTFAFSGIAHELLLYVWCLKFTTQQAEQQEEEEQEQQILSHHHHHHHHRHRPPPKYGYHLAFFTWNGMIVIAEYIFSKHFVIRYISNHFPRPIITFLVIMTVLPIAHWFTDEVVRLGVFEDVLYGFPQFTMMIKPLT